MNIASGSTQRSSKDYKLVANRKKNDVNAKDASV